MTRSPRRFALPLLAAVALSPLACSGEPPAEEARNGLTEPGRDDLPWEVRSRSGETYLPNVFYAEASENEQIMPLTIGGRYQIDRLIYPTLGNPNLYTKDDPNDEFMTVVRLERDLVDALHPTLDAPAVGSSFLRHFDLPAEVRESPGEGLHVFLVSRAARDAMTEYPGPVVPGDGIIEVRPTAMYAHAVTDDMPEAFRDRMTLRLVFDPQAMAAVPAGLYDVRFEVRRGGQIALSPGRGAGVGNKAAYEYQFNALRVFDKTPQDYSVINVTDTQVSHSRPSRGPSPASKFERLTLAHLVEFVDRVNASTEPEVRDAAFVTFNGDLHNGGSPEILRPSRVAWTYNDEAIAVLDVLKNLRVPIFLTAGNHDGYVATGHVPVFLDRMLGRVVDWVTGSEAGTLRETVEQAEPKAWPGFSWDGYSAFLNRTREQPGGAHVDLHGGAHRRVRGVREGCVDCFRRGWIPVPRDDRNYILYDGFYQWHRTYGPTYASWSLGKTRYVGLNTYELRQHRRSGYGMYTVNYGGGMSQVQMEWLGKELTRTDADGLDVVLLGHHDPRGGHNGKDFPYYFKLLEFRGLDQSAANYVKGEIINPKICELVPRWAQSHERELSCLHDGLQEWMRADTEFDCDERDRFPDERGTRRGLCDENRYSGADHPWYSGYELMDLLMLHPSVRTVLLGHTHYNAVEVLHAGEALVPARIVLDAETIQREQAVETTNPLRAFSLFRRKAPRAAYNPEFLTPGLTFEGDDLVVDLKAAGHAFADHTLRGSRRELVVLRLTSNSDMTTQRYVGAQRKRPDGDEMYGFATLHVNRRADARAYAHPQINEVSFYLNESEGSFEAVDRKAIDRTESVKSAQVAPENPFCSIFRGAGAEGCR